MARNELAFSSFAATHPDDVRFQSIHTAAMELVAPFGLRRRPLEGVLPSGSLTVDAALGVGGLPRGRMIEVFGPASIGKTTLALQAVAAVQQSGDTAAFVDVERTFDRNYALQMGVNLEALLLARPEDGREALSIIETLVACKAVDLIVVDSVAALLPPEERDVALGDASPFGQSELLASGLRRLARALRSSPACVLFLNQIRAYRGFGHVETSVGGWPLKLHAAVRADLRSDSDCESVANRRVRIHVVKNQLAEPRTLEFEFAGGVGVVPEAEWVVQASETGVIGAGIGNRASAAVEGLVSGG